VFLAQITAILGTSGAGKTTLMDVLSGKLEKTEGTMWINGMEDSLIRHRRYFGNGNFVPIPCSVFVINCFDVHFHLNFSLGWWLWS
jgi:ABC-type transport system involved in cytochrome bd biosynthesis fused ATPase/permease subunit